MLHPTVLARYVDTIPCPQPASSALSLGVSISFSAISSCISSCASLSDTFLSIGWYPKCFAPHSNKLYAILELEKYLSNLLKWSSILLLCCCFVVQPQSIDIML